jgi:hypothetical protein
MTEIFGTISSLRTSNCLIIKLEVLVREVRDVDNNSMFSYLIKRALSMLPPVVLPCSQVSC